MLMILVSSFIFIASLTASNISADVASSKTELSQLITIDAYNYDTIEEGANDSILKDPEDTFRLNNTKSYLYLNSNSTICKILLQCKVKDPKSNFSINKYKWSQNGSFEPSQDSSTFILELSDKSGATDIGCFGTDSASGAVAVAYFHVIFTGQSSKNEDVSNTNENTNINMKR